jgi:hypothetical protein
MFCLRVNLNIAALNVGIPLIDFNKPCLFWCSGAAVKTILIGFKN